MFSFPKLILQFTLPLLALFSLKLNLREFQEERLFVTLLVFLRSLQFSSVLHESSVVFLPVYLQRQRGGELFTL